MVAFVFQSPEYMIGHQVEGTTRVAILEAQPRRQVLENYLEVVLRPDRIHYVPAGHPD